MALEEPLSAIIDANLPVEIPFQKNEEHCALISQLSAIVSARGDGLGEQSVVQRALEVIYDVVIYEVDGFAQVFEPFSKGAHLFVEHLVCTTSKRLPSRLPAGKGD